MISRLIPRLQKLVRSSAFRLILLYMMLFGISVGVLLWFIGMATMREMENQARQTVNIQLADLGRKFILDGPADMRDTINHLIAKDVEESFIYLFIGPLGEVITGNLNYWPQEADQPREWIRFPLDREIIYSRNASEAMATSTLLPGDYKLLVGYNLASVRRLQQIYGQVLLLSLGLGVLLAAFGGAIITRMISRRLETVNDVCRLVMVGQLDQRVKVRGSGDEFDHLAENFNEMLGRINELISGVRDMSANVAHDLRTPLNRLRHRLEKLSKTQELPRPMKRDVTRALEEVDGLVATFNAILRISQAEMGAGIESFTLFSISQMTENVVELYDAVAEEKGMCLQWDIVPEMQMLGDKHLLSQAVANILDNAIKYSPVGETIRISLKKDAESAVLVIEDRGPGIPEEFHARVTEKFFRLEQSRHSAGNGLGLSLARAAVMLHGGRMYFEDNAPGLRVTLMLPREDA